MRSLIIYLFLLIPYAVASQGTSYKAELDESQGLCDWFAVGNNMSANENAENSLNDIVSVIGINKNFYMLDCSAIPNARATAYKGKRYIHYNPSFMDDLNNKEGSFYNLAIFAHEIGHHVNGHSLDIILLKMSGETGIDPPTRELQRRQEIEADEFSGFVMQKLGYTLEEASAAIDSLAKKEKDDCDDFYSSHPCTSKRYAAVKRGYEKAKSQSNAYRESPLNLDPEQYYYRGLDRAKQGNHRGAVEDFTVAIEIDAADQLAYYNRGYSKYILAGDLSDINVFDSFNSGEEIKDIMGSIEDFSKVIELDPSNYKAFHRRGTSKIQLRDYESSIKDFDMAIKINPQYSDSYYNRGHVKNIIGNYEGSKEDFTNSIKLRPDDTDAYNMRGLVKSSLGDYQGAIEDFSTGIEINPSSFKTARLYGNRAGERRLIGDYDGSIEDYTIALKFEKNLSWYIGLGTSKFYLDDYKGAIEDYTKAIELNSEYSMAYYFRGLSKSYLDDDKGAIEDYTYAISLDSENYSALLDRGMLLFELERFFDAIGDLNRAIDMKKNDYRPYFYRAMIKINFGQDGCEDLKKALYLSEEDKESKRVEKLLSENCN